MIVIAPDQFLVRTAANKHLSGIEAEEKRRKEQHLKLENQPLNPNGHALMCNPDVFCGHDVVQFDEGMVF